MATTVDYRMNPQAPGNPWIDQLDPGADLYTPSQSMWGHLRGPGLAGLGTLGAMGGLGALAPMAGLTAAALPAGLAAFALANGQQAFGGLNEVKSGEFFKNLGDLQRWQSFGTLGMSDSKRERDAAREARANAVGQWRMAQTERLGELLGQSGSDVRRDLGGELAQALGAGGVYGDEDAIRDAMAKFEQRRQQYMLGRSRAGQVRQLDAAFADPRLAADRQRRLGAERDYGLSRIAEQFTTGQRANAFNQARRGMLGGSTDVEQRGELARGRDRMTANLQAGLDAKSQQYRLGDQAQRNALMGLIYSDDPATAQAYQRTLEGLGQQSRQLQEQTVIDNQMTQQRQAAATGYSQGIGGALTAGSRPLEYYLTHSGTGG